MLGAVIDEGDTEPLLPHRRVDGGRLALFGAQPGSGAVYTPLYEKSLEGDADCGGVLVCNYLAGEGVTHLDEGRPLVVRRPDSRFTLANFLRATLYSTMAALKIGMDILAEGNTAIDSLTGHGGLFKTPVVGQRYLAAACNAPVTCMETAGEGGPDGMALLAADMRQKAPGGALEAYRRTRRAPASTAQTKTAFADAGFGPARCGANGPGCSRGAERNTECWKN